MTYNATIPGIVQMKAAAGKHVIFVDQFKDFPTSELADGVHPNDAQGLPPYGRRLVRRHQAVPALIRGLVGDTARLHQLERALRRGRCAGVREDEPSTPTYSACSAKMGRKSSQ